MKSLPIIALININTINNEIIECKGIELFNFENSVGKENIFSLICMKYWFFKNNTIL